MKERLSWIDVARGIGIILVIYGHAIGATTARFLIYSFHMPLFFFLSGLVFRGGKNKPYIPFITKDFKRIMIPYFIYAVFFFLFWLSKIPSEKITIELVGQQVFGIFYGSGNNHYLTFNTVLWFLPCLFLTKQVFWFVSKLPVKLIIFSLILFSVFGYLFSVFFPLVKLPLGFETMLTAIVFFGAGFLWNFIPQNFTYKFKKYALPLFILFISITIFFAVINFNLYGHQIDLRLNRLNNYYFFYISALCGILATILISMIINKNKVLEYLGRNTMILFVWHAFVFAYITQILLILFSHEKVSEFRNLFFAPAFYTVSSILVILGLKEIFKRVRNKYKKLPSFKFS